MSRRRAYDDELGEKECRMIQDLSGPDWRLLVTGAEDGKATVEVAHEVLLRDWPRLANWLREEQGFLQWKTRLEHDRKYWEQMDFDEGSLLRGMALEQAATWLEDRSDDLSDRERAYITESDAFRRREQLSRPKRQLMQSFSITMIGILATILLNGFWYLAMTAVIERQTAETIESEIRGLAEQYRQQGVNRLVQVIAVPGTCYLITGSGDTLYN